MNDYAASFDGAQVLITGEVDRTTEFERGMPFHEAFRNGRWEPDPLLIDEQALVVHVRDRGLVVLTGCGHAGAVNIARHAMRLTGVIGAVRNHQRGSAGDICHKTHIVIVGTIVSANTVL